MSHPRPNHLRVFDCELMRKTICGIGAGGMKACGDAVDAGARLTSKVRRDKREQGKAADEEGG